MQFDESDELVIEPLNDSTDHFRFFLAGTSATISDRQGNLLFYTNGFEIRDSSNNLIPGGDSLMPLSHSNASLIAYSQSILILPMPGAEDEFMILSSSYSPELGANLISNRIYYHRLKAGSDGFYMLEKNQTILEGDTIQPGRIQAVRHANGRDWWLKFGKLGFLNQNVPFDGWHYKGMYIYLLSPQGMQTWDYYEFDSPLKTAFRGQSTYNQTGDLFITHGGSYTSTNSTKSLVIQAFNRCTGTLDAIMIDSSFSEDGNTAAGCIVAPGNRYLFAYSGWGPVYQYDLESADILQSRLEIGNILPYNPSLGQAGARSAVLGPDGKIYIRTFGMSEYFHLIHYPDEAGIAAGFEEYGLELPFQAMPAAPNFANLCLGALEGSPCDTLGMPYNPCAALVSVVDIHAYPLPEDVFEIYPNPATETITLNIPEELRHFGNYRVEIHNQLGQRVLSDSSGSETLQIGHLPAGMYFVSIRTEQYVFKPQKLFVN